MKMCARLGALLVLAACRPSPPGPAPASALAIRVTAPRVDAGLSAADRAAAASDVPPPGPGARLLAARRVAGGLVAPPDWIGERPSQRGIWPSRPALSLREAWVARSWSVCRTATWDAPLEEVARDADPRFVALVASAAQTAVTETMRSADSAEDDVRIRLDETRQRFGHMGRGALSEPLTTLFICVDGIRSSTPADAARVFLPAAPSSAPLVGLVDLAEVSVLAAELERRRDGQSESSVHLVLTDDAQTRVADWLVAGALASRHPTIPWAFDSSDPRRSFVFYPPRGENLVTIISR